MLKKYNLEVIVFFSGLTVMIVELDGSRIIAPYFGTSLYVWTSIIGVILGSLSLGYWWGGKLADKKPEFSSLSKILFIAAISIGALSILKDPLLASLQNTIKDVRAGSVVSSILFFALPNIMLGMVSPYAAKLKIKALANSGSTVGNLYALSTVGSILGTFLAGFYLIPAMGNSRILLLVSAVLILISIYAYAGNLVKKLAVTALLFLLAGLSALSDGRSAQAGYVDLDSQYNRILVTPSVDVTTGRPIRNLYTDPFGIQSAMFTDRDNDLVFKYARYFRLAPHFNPNIKKALMLGGGGYTFARDFLEKNPDATIDVIEIDPTFTKIAKSYFNLKDDPRLKIIHADGRIFLNQNNDKYDAIYIDTFKSLTPPFQLTTKEAVEKVYSHLNDGGVVMINLVSAIDGSKSEFLKALNSTYLAVFPQVYVLPIITTKIDVAQNIIMVAIKSDQKPIFNSENLTENTYLSHVYEGKIGEGKILTDDYAPVENLMQNVYTRVQ